MRCFHLRPQKILRAPRGIKLRAKDRHSFSTLYFVAGYLTYPWIDGSPFNSYWCLSVWFCLRIKDFEYICETKTRELPFWFSTIKADLILSENSQLAIFAARYGGVLLDRLPVVSELCTWCALSIFVAISTLDASVRTFDISSIRTFLVSHQEFLLAWCLMFLKIRVFLKDLFFNSSISLSSSPFVSLCLLICLFWSLIWKFRPLV